MIRYALAGAAALTLYGVSSFLFWQNRDFVDDGPLSFSRPAASAALSGGIALDEIDRGCRSLWGSSDPSDFTMKIVGATIGDTDVYACYRLNSSGSVYGAKVVDADGFPADDSFARQGGAWPYIGLVKSKTELALGAFGLLALIGLFFVYYRRPRPGRPSDEPWYNSRAADLLAGALCGVLLLVLAFRPNQSRARKVQLLLQTVLIWSFVVLVVLLLASFSSPELVSYGTLAVLLLCAVGAWIAAMKFLAVPQLVPAAVSTGMGLGSQPVPNLVSFTPPRGPSPPQPPSGGSAGPPRGTESAKGLKKGRQERQVIES